ncbi:hypothetical protein C8R44DRAFT_745377 [Mycena epipterygia]|nr:hypothetical protein C8R44DRAFT_745377 [Mycena epipterygia]
MCPDKKLQWFKSCGWTAEAVEEVWQLVISQWEKSYKVIALQPPTLDVPSVPAVDYSPWLTPTARTPVRATYTCSSDVHLFERRTPVRAADGIHSYLDDPPIPTIIMEAAGDKAWIFPHLKSLHFDTIRTILMVDYGTQGC